MNDVGTIGYRYRLGAQLGAGGMGTVYRAYDRLNGTEVALKQVNIPLEFLEFMSRATLGATTGLWTALAEEFKTLSSLRHPHIISVLDYGFDAHRQPYYTMELLSQPTNLLSYGAEKTIPDKINLIIQVLQALAYLHRRGVIHRDLKPDNVLVVAGQAKVLDFGLAMTRGRQAEDTPAGTLHHMAPEVLSGQSASFSSDLYAVGVMAYQLLADQLPFHADGSIDDLIDAIIARPVDTSRLAVDAPLSSVINKLLTKTRAERYATATECILALSHALGQQPPAETIALRESFIQAAEFVGRQPELQQLKAALQQAISGTGSGWLVGGESGVGKSRLLDELRTHALVEGALVVRGQAVEGGGLPYQLWRDPLRRLVLSVELSDLEAGVLKPIVSDISTLLEREIPDAPELPGDAGQQRLAQVIVDVIRRQPQPILLLLEDLQWSQDSLDFLQKLSLMVTSHSILMVGNYRNDERANLPIELPSLNSMLLTRLTQAEISQLTAEMLGETGKDPLIVKRLEQETEGNTFFMVEVVRAWADVAGRLGDIGQLTLPRTIFAGGIQNIVHRRLDRVPEWGQPLLQIVAIAGRQLDLAVIKHVLEANHAALPHHSLDEWLRACADVAVFDLQDEHWRFAHDKLREGLIGRLVPASIKNHHRTIAQAVERTYLSEAVRKPYLEKLLFHWGEADETDKEIQYALLVAEHIYIEQGRNRDAQLLLERVEKLLPSGGATATKEAIKLLQLLSNTIYSQGKPVEALQKLRAAIGLATESDDREMLCALYAELASYVVTLGQYDEARTAIQFSSNLAEKLDAPLIRATCYSVLGQIVTVDNEFNASLEYYRKALHLYQDLGMPYKVAQCLDGMGVTYNYMGDFQEAINHYQRSHDLAQSIGATWLAVAALGNLAYSAFELGDWETAHTKSQRSLLMRVELGDKCGMLTDLDNLAWVAIREERWDAARGYADQLYQLAVELDDFRGILSGIKLLAQTALFVDDWATVRVHCERGLLYPMEEVSNKPYAIWMHNALGDIDQLEGKLSDAEQHYQAAFRLATEADLSRAMPMIYPRLALNDLQQGRRDTALSMLIKAFDEARHPVDWQTKPEVLSFASHYFVLDGSSERAQRCANAVISHPRSNIPWRKKALAVMRNLGMQPSVNGSINDTDLDALIEELSQSLQENPTTS
ncbi:MAG: tetratricopeptide repeat protein [Chloroflexota bacterium]|nr:tetratricopeptide repeat protein [Chloroflexota bacterium]